MNTPMKVTALPPVQLSAFQSGAPRPPHDGLIRRADRERYGLEPWSEPAENKVIEPKSPTEKHVQQARRTLRDMKSESARRTLTRVSAKLKARKFPSGEREAAEALYKILNR